MTVARAVLKRPDDDPEEARLLAQLQSGDLSACNACVNAHSDMLFRLALRLLGDEAAAEDVVQETFLNAFKGLRGFDGRSKLSTWLFRIAYNNALMRLRAQAPLAPLDEDEEGPATAPVVMSWRETPEEVLSRQELREVLDRAIDQLSPSLRAVFELRDLQERSTAETAKILGLSPAAVKVRLHRARLALRGRLNNYLGAPAEVPPESLTCQEVTGYLSDYIDNELDEPLLEAARQHITTCKRCHVLLDTTRDTITLCREQDRRVIPAASRQRLAGEIRAGFLSRQAPS